MQDNYRLVTEQWREKALKFDFSERYRTLGLWGDTTAGDRKIRFFGKVYGIGREDARLYEEEHPDREVNFNTAMAIYHIFCYSQPCAKAAGMWVPLREIRRAAPFERAFLQQTLEPFARRCDGRVEELRAAGERLGFRKLAQSDAGMEAQVFDCLPIRLLFWDGDEEFPAQANILFDANANDFLHEETVIMTGMELTARLLKEMG